ncbi:MAG: tetratricopeptide repeat protein [Synechococcales cyanobacterium C42_A2020_086]|jgi:tetratricopeptide (TPR) repeat protein|nr:tetratricopeptide repeat protein [Synechococcales cyanobacterium C42_A2020_086]
MRIHLCLAVFAVALLLRISTAIAQTEPLPPPEIPSSPLPSPESPPLLPSQQESVRQLIEEEIQKSRDIGDRIEEEIHTTFGWTLELLNVLIAVLIAIPLGTGFVLWFLRRSIIDQLVDEIKKQIQNETEAIVKQHLEQQVTATLKIQVEAARAELEILKTEFNDYLVDLSLDAQNEKERIFQELSQITPSVVQEELVSPEIQQRIKDLTEQLELLKSENAKLPFSAYEYVKAGDAFYVEQRYDAAVHAYEQALEINPDFVEAWLGKAKTLRRLQRFEEAIAANEQVIQLQPHNPWGWFGKGYALQDRHQFQEALAAYDKAIQLRPDRHTFWKHKAYVLTKLADYSEAMFCFEKAISLKPNSIGTYYWKAYYHTCRNQSEVAVENLRRVLHQRPDFLAALKADPDFDALRDTYPFQQLMAEVSQSEF